MRSSFRSRERDGQYIRGHVRRRTYTFVVVNVQFAPTATTPGSCKATLLIQGDTWNPVSIPIAASVGALSISVPPITVRQGASTTVEVTVTSTTGGATTANLIIEADGSADAPNVTATLSPSSLSVDKSKSASTKIEVSAGSTLATGSYNWSLAVWAFDKAGSAQESDEAQAGVSFVVPAISVH